MFQLENARGKCFRCVAWRDRQLGLAEDFAGIYFFDDEMDRAAVLASPASSARAWV